MAINLSNNTSGFLYDDYSDSGTTANYYWATTSGTVNADNGNVWVTDGNVWYYPATQLVTPSIQTSQGRNKAINPILYFKYVKKKFKLLERRRMDGFLGRLEKAYEAAKAAGQEVLGKKVMTRLAIATREAPMYAKGIRYFIERDDLERHRHLVRGGKIADTKLKDYTRVIPKDVLEKKKKVEECFDDFVIYHYWNESEQKDTKKMDSEEKAKMRDPIIFGIVKETNRLYFIADWDDEYCDLSFDELVDVVGKEEDKTDESFEINKNPQLV